VPCTALSGPGTLVSHGEKRGNAFHLARRQFLEHLLITYPLTESSNDRGVRDTRNGTSYLGEARDECPERLSGFLPHGVEVSFHTMLLVRTGEVRSEPPTELLSGLNRPRSEVPEPNPGWPSQGYMKVARHDSVVTTSCCDGGNVHLQEFRRISGTVVLLQQVWAELGRSCHREEVIRQRSAAHPSHRGARLQEDGHNLASQEVSGDLAYACALPTDGARCRGSRRRATAGWRSAPA